MFVDVGGGAGSMRHRMAPTRIPSPSAPCASSNPSTREGEEGDLFRFAGRGRWRHMAMRVREADVGSLVAREEV